MTHHVTKEAIVIKVIVLGSANVGKTALMERYCQDKFSEKRCPTIGSDFRTKILEINDTEVVLQVWDTAGQERFHHGTLGNAFYRGANGAMLVYDVMNPRSIQQLAQWRDEAVSKIDADVYFPIVVIGNKLDLRVEKLASTKMGSPTHDNRKNFKDFKEKDSSISEGDKNIDRNSDNKSSSSVEVEEEPCGDDTWTEAPGLKTDDSVTVQGPTVGLLLPGDEPEESECKDSQQTVLQWCRNNSYGHLETSAKDDIGIQAAMQTIAALALEAYKTNPKNEENSKKNTSLSKKINLNELYAPKSKSGCETCGI